MTPTALRLRESRIRAGFVSARSAAERFGWSYATYAGHENGNRGIKTDVLRVYARAFKVTTAWLMDGKGEREAVHSPPGFSEPDVTPFLINTPKRKQTIDQLIAALAPNSRHQMVLRCTRDYLGLGIRKGDLLVLGTPNGEATDGIVVVNMVDENHDTATTVLRQLKNNTYFAPVGHELEDEDELAPAVMGHVLAVVRAPQLLD